MEIKGVLIQFSSGYYGGYLDHVWQDLIDEYGHSFEFRRYTTLAHNEMIKKFNITVLPTFMLYRNGKCIKRLEGGNFEKLASILNGIE